MGACRRALVGSLPYQRRYLIWWSLCWFCRLRDWWVIEDMCARDHNSVVSFVPLINWSIFNRGIRKKRQSPCQKVAVTRLRGSSSQTCYTNCHPNLKNLMAFNGVMVISARHGNRDESSKIGICRCSVALCPYQLRPWSSGFPRIKQYLPCESAVRP